MRHTPGRGALAGEAFLLLGCLCLMGCGAGPTYPLPLFNAGPLQGSWQTQEKDHPVGGVDEATVWLARTTDGKQALVVWGDVGLNQSQSSGSVGGNYVAAFAVAPDGRRIQWKAEAGGGQTIAVTINGETYNLSGGALFLVSTGGGQTKVLQSNRDVSGW